MSSSVYSDTFSMEDSLCKDCKYRFSMTILPLDYEEYDIDIDEIDVPDNEDLFVERHVCLVLQNDINGVVLECSGYSKKDGMDFFSRNPY